MILTLEQEREINDALYGYLYREEKKMTREQAIKEIQDIYVGLEEVYLQYNPHSQITSNAIQKAKEAIQNLYGAMCLEG